MPLIPSPDGIALDGIGEKRFLSMSASHFISDRGSCPAGLQACSCTLACQYGRCLILQKQTP